VCLAGRGAGVTRLKDSGMSKPVDALAEARELQLSAARVGFDWPDVRGAVSKLREEVDELDHAIERGEAAEIAVELGDVLFSAVNVSRFVSVDPSEAIRVSSRKFEGRFSSVGEELERRGRRFDECSLDELDSVWELMKSREARGGQSI